jgi:4-amino-4-deoxy-L-arabinose transferase-like glycosyltransferase
MDRRRRPPLSRLVFVLAAVKLLAHLVTASHYPLHGDELYYVMCGRHLAWSFPDHPPLVPLLARLVDLMVGPHPFWLRLGPALIGAGLVFLAGWLAFRFGGGRKAQGLASGAILLAPLFLLSNSMLQTVSLDQASWAVATSILVLMLDRRVDRMWAVLGFVLALGVLAKLTALVWAMSLFLGLMMTRDRELLKSRWFGVGAVTVALAALPVFLWQSHHDWPVREFIAASRADDPVSPLDFLVNQVTMSGPLIGSALVIGGFYFLLRSPAGKRWWSPGWCFWRRGESLTMPDPPTSFCWPGVPSWPSAFWTGSLDPGLWSGSFCWHLRRYWCRFFCRSWPRRSWQSIWTNGPMVTGKRGSAGKISWIRPPRPTAACLQTRPRACVS